MVKIYTKTGDKGQTSLFGGQRVPKDSPRIEAYGTIDELNSALGFARSLNESKEVDALLGEIQIDLFTLGADLATPRDSTATVRRVEEADISRLERHIDSLDAGLEPLQNFILPGGSQVAAVVHLARTVCRRAERLIVKLGREEAIGELPVVYLNRLSDLLFVLSRWINAKSRVDEHKWNP